MNFISQHHHLIIFVVGLVVGGVAGFVGMALLTASRDFDNAP